MMTATKLKTQLKKSPPSVLFLEGWNLLKEKFGQQKATQFMEAVKFGFGDSVQERKSLWKKNSIKSIVRELKKFEQKG